MKRGLNPLTLVVTMVIGCVMLLLLITFLKSFYYKINHYGDEDAGCKASVIAAANTKVGVAEHLVSVGTKELGKSDFGIDCPADDLVVEGDEGPKVLAESMRGCWEKFGEGKLNPFPDWDPRSLTDQKICAICSIAEIKDNITGFDKYLSDTKMYKSDVTYLDYFTDGNIGTRSGVSVNLKKDGNHDGKYATVFMLHKSKNPEVFWQAFGVGAVVYGIPSLTLSALLPYTFFTAPIVAAVSAYGAYSAGVEYEDKYKNKYTANVAVIPYVVYDQETVENLFGLQNEKIDSSVRHFCDTIAAGVEGLK